VTKECYKREFWIHIFALSMMTFLFLIEFVIKYDLVFFQFLQKQMAPLETSFFKRAFFAHFLK